MKTNPGVDTVKWKRSFNHGFKWTLLISLTCAAIGCSKSSPSENQQTAQITEGERIEGSPIVPLKPQDAPLLEGDSVTIGSKIKPTTSLEPETDSTSSQVIQEPISASQPERRLELLKEVSPDEQSTPQPSASEQTESSDTPKYLSVSFERLASFEYRMPEDMVEPIADEDGKVYENQIPEKILGLNLKEVSLKGFMLPLKVEKGLVTEMLIMRDQSMCCYGTVPKINEWVSVRMQEEGVKPIMDEPVTVFGTLKVGEVLENGYLVGIYEMNGKSMEKAVMQ
ncbi:MAG: DUF3299 domain-containing protein [Verrucomicrobiota bacterium]|nr:DUF3299 domain-containing protein [Verrucomicrobiota bacterium]